MWKSDVLQTISRRPQLHSLTVLYVMAAMQTSGLGKRPRGGGGGGGGGGARQRTRGPRGPPYSKKQWRSFRNKMSYYGHWKYEYPEKSYITYPLRDQASLARYGLTRAGADATQIANRDADRMVGRGMYGSSGQHRVAASQRSSGGRGSYLSTYKRLRKKYVGRKNVGKLGQLAGGFAGNAAAMAVDKVLGPQAGMLAGDIVKKGTSKFIGGGRGSYNTNVLVEGSSYTPMAFASMTDEQGDMICTHSEYVRDIYGNPSDSDFEVQCLNINPGLEQTFPWLSQIAQNFDEYVMIQCLFTFRSTLTDVISDNNGQVGQVIMVTQYNVDKPAFAQKHLMMQYNGSQSSRSTESALHGIECDPAKLSGAEGKRIRTKPLPKGNLMDYDHAKFQLAVSNTPVGIASQTIGELWVSYKVLLRKPKFFTSLGYGISMDRFIGHGDGSEGGNGVSRTDPFGVLFDGTVGRPLVAKDNSIGVHCSAVQGDNSTINPTLTDYSLWNYASTGTPASTLAPDASTGVHTLTNIDTVLANGTDVSGTPGGCWIRLIFPAHIAGNYEITLHCEANTANLDTVVGDQSTTAMALAGNMHPIFDMTTGGYPLANSGTSFVRRSNVSQDARAGSILSGFGSASSSHGTAVGILAVYHVHVEIASKGKDNAIYIPLMAPSDTGSQGWDQTSVKVTEYASNRELLGPTYVDNAGVEQDTHIQYMASTVNDNVTDTNADGPTPSRGRYRLLTS